MFAVTSPSGVHTFPPSTVCGFVPCCGRTSGHFAGRGPTRMVNRATAHGHMHDEFSVDVAETGADGHTLHAITLLYRHMCDFHAAVVYTRVAQACMASHSSRITLGQARGSRSSYTPPPARSAACDHALLARPTRWLRSLRRVGVSTSVSN